MEDAEDEEGSEKEEGRRSEEGSAKAERQIRVSPDERPSSDDSTYIKLRLKTLFTLEPQVVVNITECILTQAVGNL